MHSVQSKTLDIIIGLNIYIRIPFPKVFQKLKHLVLTFEQNRLVSDKTNDQQVLIFMYMYTYIILSSKHTKRSRTLNKAAHPLSFLFCLYCAKER